VLPQPPQRAQTLFNDYKPHPTTANTVPASLFKNLSISNAANGEMDADADDDDEKPLSTLMAKLSSTDRFDHNQRPSLDDIHMPMIARKVPRAPENHELSPKLALVDATEVSEPTSQQLSVPAVPRAPVVATTSPQPSAPQPQGPNNTMDEKVDILRNDVRNLVESYLLKINNATSTRAEEALMRIARLMREQADERQAQETTAARSAVDPQAIRGIIQESNKEVCVTVQRDLTNFARHIQENAQVHPGADILRTVEEQASRVITAVSGATENLATRLEAVHSMVESPPASIVAQSHPAGHARVPSHEDLLRVLRPHLEQLRSASFDVDVVTARLADAVKPTLADFIDLASDKGETADLIVAKLGPIFAAMRPSQLDTQEIATQLAADVSRLVPPVDSHALTEQVADLVVERLDSRLSVREKALKPEFLVQKVKDALQPLVSSGDMNDIRQRLSKQDEYFKSHGDQMQALENAILQTIQATPTMDKPIHQTSRSVHTEGRPAATAAYDSQRLLSEMQKLLQQHGSSGSISEEALAQSLRSQLEPLASRQSTLVEATQQSQNMLDSGLSDIFHAQDATLSQLQDLLTSSAKILTQTSRIPDHVTAIGQSLNSAQMDFLSKLRSLPDLIDLQNQRIESQVQLNKAIKSHGQVRSEKDVLGERVQALESERDRLRAEIQSLKGNLTEKDSEMAASISKAEQVDKALQQALSRVETSEAVIETLKEQVLRMEGVQRDLQRFGNERQAKVCILSSTALKSKPF
jgi:chromosome segregation ATPase